MNRSNKRMLAVGIAVVLVAILSFGCGKANNPDRVIAEVEGTSLTYAEMLEQLEAEDVLNPGIAETALEDKEMLRGYAEQLVIRKKLHEQAMAANFTYDEEILEQEMAMILLEHPEMTTEQQESVRKLIDHYIAITEYLNDQVTEVGAREFYEENTTEFTRASVRHILIDFEGRSEEEALQLANSLTERIRQGEDMAELAKEYTGDTGSQENGGLYENQTVMMWVPEFKEAALTFELNVVGDPVETQFGYHVIRVEDRTVTPFEQLEAMIQDNLAAELFQDFMKSVEGKTTVNL